MPALNDQVQDQDRRDNGNHDAEALKRDIYPNPESGPRQRKAEFSKEWSNQSHCRGHQDPLKLLHM